MTSEVMKAVKRRLDPVCPSMYFGRSAAVYPKIVGDLRLISAEDEKKRYRLILDFYVEGQPIEAVRLAEEARLALHKTITRTGKGVIAIWQSDSGYLVPEKDGEKLAHYSDSYEISYFNGKEGS